MNMARILCATRGGASSYRAQDGAIRLAGELGGELIFLYVVNIGFLDTTARAVRPDVVEAEMEKLGEFLLEMARERAAGQGVRADTILRHGVLPEELPAAASEHDIDIIVLGKPAEGGVYSLEELEAFAAGIEAKTGSQVLVL
jgi:nucleotide-binding universal stress UspA family protein